MRYFKWGVARLILESEPCPDIVPIWVEGPDQVMHESRTFPRFIPRPGKNINITFGDKLDADAVFGDLRERWKRLSEKELGEDAPEIGILSDKLKYGDEAVELRKECTMRMRKQILKLRQDRGWSDEDPKAGLVETKQAEDSPERDGQMKDGSWIKDT